MQNRNFLKSGHKRPVSNFKSGTSNYQISFPKNFDFLEEHFTQPGQSSLQSPIMKMKFQLSPDISRVDTLNYSSNTYNQNAISKATHKSYAQSPQKQNISDANLNYLASKKYSIPDAKMLAQAFHRQKNQSVKKNHGSNDIVKPLRKLNGRKNGYRIENQQEFEKNCQQPTQFYSQQLIESNSRSEQIQKYQKLTMNYQELQRELDSIRQENMRLKRSKEELMNQNIQIKRQSSANMNAFSNQIDQLKEQIYRMEMERQQTSSHQLSGRGSHNMGLGFSRESGMMSARGGFSQQMQNGNVNLFYVEQLQKQNDQLIRQNRRLNEIVMKRLRNSITQ